MIKKVCVIGVVLGVLMFLMIPSGAAPTDVVLDQQVTLEVPGTFELVDQNQDQKAEAINFQVNLQSYREGNYIVTGNLEGMRSGRWVSLATSVIPFRWTPTNRTIAFNFRPDNIRKYQVSGPYRVVVSLRDGDWQLDDQVVGFSPKYVPENFSSVEHLNQGPISSAPKAKQAVETWANYKAINLGKLLGISFNYDHWQVDYEEKNTSTICRFTVNPQGMVKLIKI